MIDENEIKNKMSKVIETLESRYTTIRAGRANPNILHGIMVDYYGNPTPIQSLATISIPEARVLSIKPFDKSSLKNIEKAIFEANLGYTPGNDGENIRIVIPDLTEERRKELVKQVKSMAEEGKVSIRNIRREAMEDVEKLKLPEDEEKGKDKQIQDLVNKYNKIVEDKLKEKETELLTV